MVDNTIQHQEQVKKLKRLLEGWRMALLPLKSVMLWEQQWYPCAIVGAVSFLYLLIWLMDLNSLTTFALIGFILNLMDFMVPLFCKSLYGQGAWTGQHEKKFEDICCSIVASYNTMLNQLRSFYSMRESSPLMYYLISIGFLLILAWISSTINNIFLLYILSITMLLWPGVQHKGLLNTLLSLFNKTPKQLKSE